MDVLYRQTYSKMVSAMVSYFGLTNLAIAEDIVQDTFLTAMERWKADGEPEDKAAWLFKVCKHKAINHLQKASSAVRERVADADSRASLMDTIFLDSEIRDSQLRLLFACCDDRLSPKSQIILILKNLCGLRIPEIANALLMSEEAVTKGLTRSKQTLAQGGTLSVPPVSASRRRLSVVHTAIYLMFSEGYSATEGAHVIRRELCVEAMRLMKSILETDTLANYDTYALMALMCLHSSRFEARVDAQGTLVELEKQDRSRWDKELIKLGIHYLKYAHDSKEISRFVLEAAIASVHAVATEFQETNWEAIVGLYDRLSELQPTPFVDLNRTVAIFYARGAAEALASLGKSRHQAWLKNYYLYYALLGKIHASLGDGLEAIHQYEKALSLCKLKAEQNFLQSRIDLLKASMN